MFENSKLVFPLLLIIFFDKKGGGAGRTLSLDLSRGLGGGAGGGGGYSKTFWVGVCHWDSQSLTLNQAKLSYIFQPCSMYYLD